MYKINNILSVVLAVIFSLTIFAEVYSQSSAQTEVSAEVYDRLETSLDYGLSSEVSGVLESALFNMLNYKVVYPEFYSEKVLNRTIEIADNSESEILRMKANIVVHYYMNYEEYPKPDTLQEELDHMDQDRIFEYLKNGDHGGQFTSTQK